MKAIGSLGYLPDFGDSRDIEFKPKLRLLKATPPVFDLRKEFIIPFRFDQGSLGSCTGNMGSMAVYIENLRSGLASPKHVSRLALYYGARLLMGTTHYDSGAYIRNIFKDLNKSGCADELLWPYKITKFKVKPDKNYYTNAELQQAIKYERVNQTLATIKACLLEKTPICLGFSVYSNLGNASIDGFVDMPQGSLEGGHAVVIAGWTNDLKLVSKNKPPSFTKKFKEWFICINSWGKKWGDGGDFYIPVEYLLNPNLATDFWRLIKLEK